jgi:menaquinone-dependent protoporphyrinogen oxidase
MKNILIVYYSRMGHTARMVRTIADELEALGNTVTVMPVSEALREGVDWSKHDFVLCGFPVVYGTYHPNVYEFVRNNCTELDRKPNAMFNVTVVARTPFKATVEGNRYMQKFLERSPWRPRDLKCFAGKIDYPHLNLFDKKCIQLIMKITNGPTDPSMCIDFTDWEDVKQYAKHISELAPQA